MWNKMWSRFKLFLSIKDILNTPSLSVDKLDIIKKTVSAVNSHIQNLFTLKLDSEPVVIMLYVCVFFHLWASSVTEFLAWKALVLTQQRVEWRVSDLLVLFRNGCLLKCPNFLNVWDVTGCVRVIIDNVATSQGLSTPARQGLITTPLASCGGAVKFSLQNNDKVTQRLDSVSSVTMQGFGRCP